MEVAVDEAVGAVVDVGAEEDEIADVDENEGDCED